MNDHDLRRRLRELPESIEPSRDLWPGIAPRLRRRFPFAAAAAIAGLLIVGGAWWLHEPPAPTTASGDSLERSRDALRAALEVSRDRLPAETQRLVDENLAVIDEAIAEIRHALADDPENADLNRTLVAYRRSELELLQRAVHAGGLP